MNLRERIEHGFKHTPVGVFILHSFILSFFGWGIGAVAFFVLDFQSPGILSRYLNDKDILAAAIFGGPAIRFLLMLLHPEGDPLNLREKKPDPLGVRSEDDSRPRKTDKEKVS